MSLFWALYGVQASFLESAVKKQIIRCPFSLLQRYLSIVLKLNNASSWKTSDICYQLGMLF
jgi:hypothetical protein